MFVQKLKSCHFLPQLNLSFLQAILMANHKFSLFMGKCETKWPNVLFAPAFENISPNTLYSAEWRVTDWFRHDSSEHRTFCCFSCCFCVFVTKASFRQSHEDSGGEMEAALLPYHEPDSRMEGFTKINTYIYHGINTGPVGTFVGVSLAAVKTTAILHLKQYYSLGCWWSCVCGSYFLRWCLNNWEWKMSILFTLILSHSSSSGLFTIC